MVQATELRIQAMNSEPLVIAILRAAVTRKVYLGLMYTAIAISLQVIMDDASSFHKAASDLTSMYKRLASYTARVIMPSCVLWDLARSWAQLPQAPEGGLAPVVHHLRF